MIGRTVSHYQITRELGAGGMGVVYEAERHHGRTGSALMVDGNCVSIGCYAMTDAKIEEIYTLLDAALGNGQPFF